MEKKERTVPSVEVVQGINKRQRTTNSTNEGICGTGKLDTIEEGVPYCHGGAKQSACKEQEL
jgi:hypothetical protein